MAARFGNLHLGLCGNSPLSPLQAAMREAHPSAHPAQAFPPQRSHSLKDSRTRRVGGSQVLISAFPHPPHPPPRPDVRGPGTMWARRGGENRSLFQGDTAHFPKQGTRLLGRFWEYRAFLPESSQGLWVEVEPLSELLRGTCGEIQPEAPELPAWT